MTLWCRIVRWFAGRGSRKPAFEPYRMPDGTVAMVDQLFLDYVHSTSSVPTQTSLNELLAPDTRVRIVDAGVLGGKAMKGRLLAEVSAPSELEALQAHVAIVEDLERFGHCLCLGWPALELYQGATLRGTLGLHHGESIRWDGWKDDAPLADPLALLGWMAHLGVDAPLRTFEEDRAKHQRAAVAFEDWIRAMPDALRLFRPALQQ
jgi:hypothetical protein